MRVHDLIGIGFGPSNLALAIAMQEHKAGENDIDMLFIERQKKFAWHPNMLLEHARMQISFLKDLVTLRNPSSRFTFINYLHEKKRLQDFINLKTFYPSRREFNDYLEWAAGHFKDICIYGEEVIDITPEKHDGQVVALRVRSRRSDQGICERLTRALVVSIGGTPNVPACFRALQSDSRIFHSSHYLEALAQQKELRKVAVIGGGQSAAEIFLDLHGRGIEVDLVLRGRAIKPSDDSPFVNEIFNPEYTGHFFSQDDHERTALINEFMNTNYAAPDLALIEQIYNVLYQQRIMETKRHRFLRRHEVVQATADHRYVHLDLSNLDTGEAQDASYDAVILATGYVRETHKALLAPLHAYLGEFKVDRYYRIDSSEDFWPAIFLQGCCEETHGLSDTLLSVTANRTEEIAKSLECALRHSAVNMRPIIGIEHIRSIAAQ